MNAARRAARLSRVVAANVYVSEGRDAALLARLEAAAAAAMAGHTPGGEGPGAVINSFADAAYGRASFTLAGAPARVAAGAHALASRACAELDLRAHGGVSHPRIGVVDHISVPSSRVPERSLGPILDATE